jgi:DNA repair protein RadC
MERYLYRIEPVIVRESVEPYNSPVLRSPEDVFKAFRHYGIRPQEHLLVVCLDSKKKMIGYTEVSRGGTNFAYIEMKHLMLPAILVSAESVILIHNHPSGEVEPSDIDIDLTERAREIFRLIGINLLDHIILAGDRYISIINDVQRRVW